jgi:Tfp pilus assembly PilM family ATPase
MKKLVLYISAKYVRFLEVNLNNEITFAEQIELSEDDVFPGGKYQSTENISTVIFDTLKKYNITAKEASLVIDSSNCFVSILPVDYDDTKENIHSNILWELSNYYPDTYKNFKINYQKLIKENPSDSVRWTLIIAINNKVSDVLKNISVQCGLKFSLLDVDHFATEKYFRKLYKDDLAKNNFLLAGFKKNRIDFSIINNKGSLFYDYILLKDSDFQKPLENYLSNRYGDIFNIKFDRIFLYGDEFVIGAYRTLNRMIKKANIILSNPYIDMKLAKDYIRTEVDIKNDGFKFTSLCGLALN